MVCGVYLRELPTAMCVGWYGVQIHGEGSLSHRPPLFCQPLSVLPLMSWHVAHPSSPLSTLLLVSTGDPTQLWTPVWPQHGMYYYCCNVLTAVKPSQTGRSSVGIQGWLCSWVGVWWCGGTKLWHSGSCGWRCTSVQCLVWMLTAQLILF